MKLNSGIVQYMPQKLKSVLANEVYFLAILLVLVAVASFLLGRASVTQSGAGEVAGGGNRVFLATTTALTPLQPAALPLSGGESGVSTPVSAPTSNLPLVASKSGTKYHLTTCPGASQIKDTNKIYFATPAEAESAGYTKAANCPGL